MRIACLGWGSLIWDPRDLPVQGDWQHDGPWLPIEFARQSADDRMTLVCVPGYQHQVQSLWILLSSPTIEAGRETLRQREGIAKKNIDSHIGLWLSGQHTPSDIGALIASWAIIQNLDAVIWTNLPPKFRGQDNRVPTATEVINHLAHLSGETREKAEKYIRLAPPQIRTPYREAIEQALQWFPASHPV
jgi:hypothetical protein